MPLQCICVDNRISHTQLGKLFVCGFQSERNDYSQEYTFGLRPACDKLINFLDSQLETRDSRLETRDLRLKTIESRSSRIEAQGTVNLLLSGFIFISDYVFGFPVMLQVNWTIDDTIHSKGNKFVTGVKNIIRLLLTEHVDIYTNG